MDRKKIKNNAKFSGHYVQPRTHNVRVHALRSHQNSTNRLFVHIIILHLLHPYIVTIKKLKYNKISPVPLIVLLIAAPKCCLLFLGNPDS